MWFCHTLKSRLRFLSACIFCSSSLTLWNVDSYNKIQLNLEKFKWCIVILCLPCLNVLFCWLIDNAMSVAVSILQLAFSWIYPFIRSLGIDNCSIIFINTLWNLFTHYVSFRVFVLALVHTWYYVPSVVHQMWYLLGVTKCSTRNVVPVKGYHCTIVVLVISQYCTTVLL